MRRLEDVKLYIKEHKDYFMIADIYQNLEKYILINNENKNNFYNNQKQTIELGKSFVNATNDNIAKSILFHEIAHLIFNDESVSYIKCFFPKYQIYSILREVRADLFSKELLNNDFDNRYIDNDTYINNNDYKYGYLNKEDRLAIIQNNKSFTDDNLWEQLEKILIDKYGYHKKMVEYKAKPYYKKLLNQYKERVISTNQKY